jgi:hypothetical protein
VIQRFDTGRIDGTQLLDQRKNAVEFVQRLRRLRIGQFDLRKDRQAFDIGKFERHGWKAVGPRVKMR